MADRWPDYLRRETLARRLNLAPGAIDQLVKRGLLPPPLRLGEALLWRWATVDEILTRGQPTATDDPYARGINAVEAPATRAPDPEQSPPQTTRDRLRRRKA
jgi:predicted DNA-binding transcriptional regulator AlpA